MFMNSICIKVTGGILYLFKYIFIRFLVLFLNVTAHVLVHSDVLGHFGHELQLPYKETHSHISRYSEYNVIYCLRQLIVVINIG
jgi:hypothetical protein